MARVTVAVPTIDGRGKYLEYCLKTCIDQDFDFEILVSDNPGGEALDIVNSLGDSRIRYIAPPTYLSMSSHWDFILSQASGDFISYIGDDDGLMPNCIGRISDIISQVGDIPIHHSLANYHWPDFLGVERRNTTVFFHPTGRGEKVVRSENYLHRVAQARARYVDGPMVYHNFIPIKLLKNLAKDGIFFRRSSPDVYSSLAIAANVDSFFSTYELLTLSGQGAKANGAAVQSGSGKDFLKNADKYHKSRFESLTIQSVLLDSYIEVAEYFDRKELLSQIVYSVHYANSLAEGLGMRGGMRANEIRFSLLNRYFIGVALETIKNRFGFVASEIYEDCNDVLRSIEFSAGQAIKMPVETSNIYEASKVIDKMLSSALFNKAPQN